MGIARRRPRGPQSQVQNTVETITASGEMPVPRPNTSGSTTWPIVSFGYQKQGRRNEHGDPARIDGRRQQYWEGSSDIGADERHESHQCGEDAPHDGARNADQPQS